MRRVISIILVASFVMVCVGCSLIVNSQKTPIYVGSEDVYWNAKEITLGNNEIECSEHVASYESIYLFGMNEIVSVLFTEDFDDEGNNCSTTKIKLIDYDGIEIDYIESTLNCSLLSIYENGNAYYAVTKTDLDIYREYVVYELDFDNKQLIEVFSFNLGDADGNIVQMNPILCDTYIIFITEYIDGYETKTGLVAVDYDGNYLWSKNLNFYSDSVKKCGNDNLLIQSIDSRIYKLFLDNCTIDEINIPDEIKNKYYFSFIGDNGNLISLNSNGYEELNLVTMDQSIYIDFNFCDIDYFHLIHTNFLSAIENKVILSSGYTAPNEPDGLIKIIILEKCDTNPYQNRIILEVAQLWYVNQVLSSTLYKYNHTQDMYYAYVTNRYNEMFEVSSIYGDQLTETEITQMITAQLMLDISNDCGPDIIVGLGSTTEMNSNKYLTDYNIYFENDADFNLDDYFQNALFSYENNIGTFQIPTEIYAYGIIMNDSDDNRDSIGFTYEEYIEFVETENNGIDPISIGNPRDNYFEFLYRNCEGLFFTDGYPNFDNEEFRALAEYTKNNVTNDGMLPSAQTDSEWIVIYGFYQDVCNNPLFWNDYTVMGAPSPDGRGLMLGSFNTIAISATTPYQNECWEFVRTLLSEEVQVNALYIPINIDAFYQKSLNDMSLNNSRLENGEMYNLHEVTEEDIDKYRNLIEEMDHSNAIDADVYFIVLEELQSYFDDSKSLDDVIDIINGRAQLVVDERG